MRPAPSDARLARRAGDGDERAFAAIFRRYHQELYRFCLSILARPEDAQEALQNTMVKALRSLPGEKREIRLKPWLYRVAHNESIDLLRRRREGPDIDSVQVSARAELAETVELRARLSSLLADLAVLPARQRSALVMRELAGLEYEQIGEAFGTSTAVARQTVYEARLGLRALEAGREMSCEEVTRALSAADGRILRRRGIQAHLRSCADCRAFRDAIPRRREDLAALAPLPAVAAVAVLHGASGGSAVVGNALGGGTGAAAVGAGAGKAATTSVALKAVATIAVAATVGVTAADRGGLVDLGLPSDAGLESTRVERVGDAATAGDGGSARTAASPSSTSDESGAPAQPGGDTLEFNPAPEGSRHGSPPLGEVPAVTPPTESAHGRAAAAHKAHGTDNRGQERATERKKTHGTDNPGQGKATKRRAHGAGSPGQGHGHGSRGPEARGKGQSQAPAKGKSLESGDGKAKGTKQSSVEEDPATPSGTVDEPPKAESNGTAKRDHEEASP